MRLSLLRLWISVGFAVLGMELALLVFVLIRTRDDVNEMRKSLAELKEENNRLRIESRSNQQELARLRRLPASKHDDSPPVNNTSVRVEISPDAAELVREYRDAVVRGNSSKALALESKLREVPDRAGPAIISAIGGESSISAKASLYSLLGSFNSRETLSYLQREILEEKERTVRLAVAMALTQMPDETSVSILEQALRGEAEAEVRQGLMRAIARTNADEAARFLVSQYDQSGEKDRAAILAMLAEMSQPKLRDFFQGVLADSKISSDRVLAVRGLGNSGDRTVLPALESLKSSDPEDSVRVEADRAILKIRAK